MLSGPEKKKRKIVVPAQEKLMGGAIQAGQRPPSKVAKAADTVMVKKVDAAAEPTSTAPGVQG